VLPEDFFYMVGSFGICFPKQFCRHSAFDGLVFKFQVGSVIQGHGRVGSASLVYRRRKIKTNKNKMFFFSFLVIFLFILGHSAASFRTHVNIGSSHRIVKH